MEGGRGDLVVSEDTGTNDNVIRCHVRLARTIYLIVLLFHSDTVQSPGVTVTITSPPKPTHQTSSWFQTGKLIPKIRDRIFPCPIVRGE